MAIIKPSPDVLELASGALAYHRGGSGPTLLLLHGSGPGVTGLENFADNFPFFSNHFDTIILDLPGYGGSAARAGVPDLTTSEAVAELIETLGLSAVSIIGNSFGGIVGARLAASRPDLVRALVCIGGLGYGLFAPFPNEGIRLLVEFAEDPSRERMAQWLRSMVHDQTLITDELIDRRLAQALEPKTLATTKQMYARTAMQQLADMLAGPAGLQSIAYAASIQCPTLLAWGRDDRVSALDRALVPMRLIPQCELHVFANCGHWVMIERQREFESIALAFLTRAA